MFYFILLIVGALGVVVYLVFILRLVPGAAEERFGVLEPLPADVGKWKHDDASPEGQAAARAGQRREERLYFEESGGLLGGGKLVRQVRYRHAQTNEIVRIDPDQPVKRKRVRV